MPGYYGAPVHVERSAPCIWKRCRVFSDAKDGRASYHIDSHYLKNSVLLVVEIAKSCAIRTRLRCSCRGAYLGKPTRTCVRFSEQ